MFWATHVANFRAVKCKNTKILTQYRDHSTVETIWLWLKLWLNEKPVTGIKYWTLRMVVWRSDVFLYSSTYILKMAT